MTKYLVFRHGSNTANQHLCDRMPVGVVFAHSQEAAKQQVIDGGITVYVNQWLTAVPMSKARAADVAEIRAAIAETEGHNQ